MTPRTVAALSALALFAPLPAGAQQQQAAPPPAAAAPAAAPLPYGMPIGFEAARKAMAAAEKEAAENNWNVAIAIVDSGGHPVMMHRLDGVQIASIRIAEGGAGRPDRAGGGGSGGEVTARRRPAPEGRALRIGRAASAPVGTAGRRDAARFRRGRGPSPRRS